MTQSPLISKIEQYLLCFDKFVVGRISTYFATETNNKRYVPGFLLQLQHVHLWEIPGGQTFIL